MVSHAVNERTNVSLGIDGYAPFATAKGHARIIWDCCWMHEQDVFATASRDKTVRTTGSSLSALMICRSKSGVYLGKRVRSKSQ